MKKGFTLIEIMIVVIIIGVLAAIALPKLTKKIGEAKSSEAVTNLGAIVRALDACYQTATDPLDCDSFGELGILDPESVAGASFTYSDVFATGNLVATCVAGKCSGTITYPIVCGLSSAAAPGCTIGTKAATGDFTGIITKFK